MEQSAIDRTRIDGWGVDADIANDPTLPIRHKLDAAERQTWRRPAQQPVDIEVLRSIERPNVTSVFGTSTPPSGLSGIVRRIAFRYSESSYLHWLPLMLADRIAIIEGDCSDIGRGSPPKVWQEMGIGAQWSYDRSALLRKGVLALAVVSAAAIYGARQKNARGS